MGFERHELISLFCFGRCLESIRFAQIQIARSVRAFTFHFGALSVSMRKIPNKRISRWEWARTERPLSWDGKLTLDTEFAHDLTYIIEGFNLKLKKRENAIIWKKEISSLFIAIDCNKMLNAVNNANRKCRLSDFTAAVALSASPSPSLRKCTMAWKWCRKNSICLSLFFRFAFYFSSNKTWKNCEHYHIMIA